MARLTITMLGGVCWPPTRRAKRQHDDHAGERCHHDEDAGRQRDRQQRDDLGRRPVLAPVAPSPRSMLTLCAGRRTAPGTQREAGEAEERRRHGFRSLLGEGGGKARRFDAGLDHSPGGRTDDDEVLHVVAADQHHLVTWPEHLHFGDAEAAPLAHFHAHAEAAQHPGEQGDEPQNQNERQGEPEIKIKIHWRLCEPIRWA
jgi:hypothetical protein